MLAKVRPGMRDFEVTALAQYEGHLLESKQGTFNGHSAPQGRRSSLMLHRHEQGRTIRAGDYLNLLIENNGPGGFYTEVSRTLVFGKASAEVRDRSISAWRRRRGRCGTCASARRAGIS